MTPIHAGAIAALAATEKTGMGQLAVDILAGKLDADTALRMAGQMKRQDRKADASAKRQQAKAEKARRKSKAARAARKEQRRRKR